MSLKKNIIANYLGQAWTAVMGLAFVPIYMQQLGMEAYGLIGLYALLQAGLVLLDLAVSQTLNREMARYTAGQHSKQTIHILLRSIEIVGLTAALIAGASIWLSARWISTYWVHAQAIKPTEITIAITMMGLVIALRVLEGLYRGGISGLQKQVELNTVGAGFATARWAGAAGVVLWFDPGITAFFAWQAFISTAAVLTYRWILFRPFPTTTKLQFSFTALKEVRSFSGGMLATASLSLLLTQADKLLLSRILALEAFGYYTLATLVANALYQIVGPITQAMFPRLTELATHDASTNLASTYHMGAQLMTAFLVPPALLLMVFGQDFLSVWTGNVQASLQVAPVLAPLALGTMLNGLMGMPHMLQLAHGWAGFAARLNVFAVVFFIPVIAWIAPRYGAVGTAWVWVALNAFYVLIGIHFMHRRLMPQEKWHWYWLDILRPAAPVVIVMYVCSHVDIHSAGRLVTWCWLAGITLLSTLVAALCAPSIRHYIRNQWIFKWPRTA